jgi:hypothetical protein
MDQMGEWLLHLPVVWMGLVIFAGTYLIAATIFWSATRLNERVRVVDPGLLSPLGVVFGLLVVFTAAQVWGDLERGGNAVATEANALREVVLLGDGLPCDQISDLQDFKVLRDSRAADGQPVCDLPDRQTAGPQRFEDLTPGGIGERCQSPMSVSHDLL